jgi:hypothetical protein
MMDRLVPTNTADKTKEISKTMRELEIEGINVKRISSGAMPTAKPTIT